MSEHDDRAVAELLATLQTGTNQRRAYSAALMRRRDRHRRETHQLQVGMLGECYGREHDVATGWLRDVRPPVKGLPAPAAKRVHEIGLERSFEGGLVDPVHGDPIAWLFSSNQHATPSNLFEPGLVWYAIVFPGERE